MEQQPITPPPMSPSRTVTYAGFWKRFAAYIIDKLILAIVVSIVCIPMILVLGIGAFSQLDNSNETPLAFLMALAGAYLMIVCIAVTIEWLYFALMESKKGATLGKMVLGIRVTDMEGRQVSFGRATGRYFSKIISGLTLGIGYIIAGFTQQKQALHDIIAKTLVINNY